MGLNPGTRLGPYEIISPLGAGGMGEVYRAQDTRLDRTVAIKVLPTHLSSNADLKQRFDREAKSISQLQHPHICTLFDVGSQNGVDFLVMEYIEGETLADRLKRGPLPLSQLLKMAIELAEALEKAHHAGLIHRDIKPGNIMLTKSGAKLLDFGLAKPSVIQPGAVGSGSGNAAPMLSGALTQSSPAAALTGVGTVVGTVQYMSPEQIAGQEADVRSDIFCFGAVLYEAAAGERAFKGKTPSAVVGAILANDPPPASSLQAGVPAAFDRVTATCLAKDPQDRFESAHDLRLQLEWVRDFGTKTPSAAASGVDLRKSAVAMALAAVVGALLSWAAFAWLTHAVPGRIIISEISPPENNVFDSIGDLSGPPVISPQGDKIAFVGVDKEHRQWLWVRSLDGASSVKLDGTDGAAHPFWSPDGTQIGFFTPSKLKRVPAAGGPVVELDTCANPRGGSWGQDGVIIYAPDFRGPIMQINAAGGKSTPATTLDPKLHTTHRWPYFLPDGKHFLYFATNHNIGNPDANGIYFASLDSKENKLVTVTDAAAQYAAGFLFFHAQNSLQAQPFNPSTGKLSGAAVMVEGNIRFDAGVWRSVFSVSDQGLLLYQLSTSVTSGSQLAWYDRSGKLIKEVGDKMHQADLRISPDGKKVAILAGDPSWEIWILDLERGGRTRITFNEGTPLNPSWSPDGKNIIYTSVNSGSMADIRTKPWYGGAAKVLSPELHNYSFPGFTADGKYLYYISTHNGGGQKGKALFARALDGASKPVIVVEPPSMQSSIAMGRVSPDGKWVAYQSDETGRDEVYIAPFPKGDGKWQVSNTGAGFPMWRADGKELFYSTLDERLSSVTINEKGDHLEIGSPQVLFTVSVSAVGYGADISADGQRILLNRAEESSATPLYMMMNWPELLKKK